MTVAAVTTPPVSPIPALPTVALTAFEGPLDLLLHLIREHKIDIADIPIVQVTDQYLAHLRAMEALNLTIAGEFLVMAATLLEIKSRMLLPKPPVLATGEDDQGEDPRLELIQRLQDYQRYKTFIATLAEWEDARRQLFFRGQAEYGNLYELPTAFGALSSKALLKALTRMLDQAAGDAHGDVTSVRRQKMTLRLAMAALWNKIRHAGDEGILFDDCLSRPLVRLEVVMAFLGLLELLRQGRIEAIQTEMLDEIRLSVRTDTDGGHPQPMSEEPEEEEVAPVPNSEEETE